MGLIENKTENSALKKCKCFFFIISVNETLTAFMSLILQCLLAFRELSFSLNSPLHQHSFLGTKFQMLIQLPYSGHFAISSGNTKTF